MLLYVMSRWEYAWRRLQDFVLTAWPDLPRKQRITVTRVCEEGRFLFIEFIHQFFDDWHGDAEQHHCVLPIDRNDRVIASYRPKSDCCLESRKYYSTPRVYHPLWCLRTLLLAIGVFVASPILWLIRRQLDAQDRRHPLGSRVLRTAIEQIAPQLSGAHRALLWESAITWWRNAGSQGRTRVNHSPFTFEEAKALLAGCILERRHFTGAPGGDRHEFSWWDRYVVVGQYAPYYDGPELTMRVFGTRFTGREAEELFRTFASEYEQQIDVSNQPPPPDVALGATFG